MTELTNSKTWTKTRVTGSGASTLISHKLLLVAIKDEFKNHGWSVISSSDSVTSDSNDNWANDTDIVIAVAGSVHSWIVLQNNNIKTGFQICIDMSVVDASARKAYFYMSPSVGFSSGTTTNRPTASDETQLNILTDYWITGTTGTSKSANVFTSSDHQCTHVFIYSGAVICGFWIFDVPKNCPSWVDNKVIAMVNGGACTVAEHDAITEAYTTMKIDGTKVNVVLATVMIGATRALSYAGVSGATGDYGGAWPSTPMWLLSVTASVPGIFGTIYDLWWSHITTVTTGDCFPSSGAKNQVVFGNMIQGNDGTALVL
jgi:hypothetical protein